MTTSDAERLHIAAVDHHLRALCDLLRTDPQGVAPILTIAACDLLTWSARLRQDVRKAGRSVDSKAEQPVRDDLDHLALGAYWARSQIVHGRAHLLKLARDHLVDNRWDTDDILWNDPETDWNGELAHPTVRFQRLRGAINGDQRPDLKPFYDHCLSGRRVVLVSALVADWSPR